MHGKTSRAPGSRRIPTTMIMQTQTDSTPRSPLATLLHAVPVVLLRLSLGVLAVMLMLGALLVGTVLTIGLLTWALLRGRQLPPSAFSATFQRGRGRGRTAAADAGPVIDVETRVVPEQAIAAGTTRPGE